MEEVDWPMCDTLECPSEGWLNPAHPFCMSCGSVNPTFDEDILFSAEGLTLGEFQAVECSPSAHIKAGQEILSYWAETGRDPGKVFCAFCGNLLVEDSQVVPTGS